MFILLFMLVPANGPAGTTAGWHSLAPGIDIRNHILARPGPRGDSRITVVRIDPDLWKLEFVGVSRTGSPGAGPCG